MNKIVVYEMKKDKEVVFGKRIIEVSPEAFEHEGGLLVMETYRNIARDGGSINLGLVEYSNHLVAGTYDCSVHHIQDNYVYIMLRNVTELEKTKNALEQKNNELQQMTNIVSHDLKDPLSSITTTLDLINTLYKGKVDEQFQELLDMISNSSSRMFDLINDLLDYGEIGTQKEMVDVDCNILVQEIKEDLWAKIKEKNVTLNVNNLPTIKAYKTELRLLFQNLISNVIKITKPGVDPIVNIYFEDNDAWVFTIEDNGFGIKEKIFNIFERLNNRHEYQGSGIGLAHCKKIIELHGGEISVDSKLGEGSTFHITLPK